MTPQTTTFTLVYPQQKPVSSLLHNLLTDTTPAILISIAEQYGLPRVPGLDRAGLTRRLITMLNDEQLQHLQADLVTARFGGQSVRELVTLALERDIERDRQRTGKMRPARLDAINPHEAILIESGPQRWVFTMRGYDVLLNLEHRHLACGCTFFEFASRRKALCKHIATGFELIPPVYAREALIDLLMWREYGGSDTPPWLFEGHRAA